MLTLLIVFTLSLLLLGFVVLPFVSTRKLDPLADERDPVALDLEEERDALYRAIREIDAREDLPQARRDALRARYEAKAAQVLRNLDEYSLRRREQAPATPAARPRGLPVTALALFGVVVVSTVLLGNYVLPRVGSDASVTTADPVRLERGREIARLQGLADGNPSTENLTALAEAHWVAENYPEAREVYSRLEAAGQAGTQPVPGVAYHRLGLFALQEGDVDTGLGYLERARAADPRDAETLFTLGDVYSLMGRSAEALAAWEAYSNLPDAVHDEALEARLERAQVLAPLQAAVADEASEENLIALADAHWDQDEREPATTLYLQIVQEVNPRNPQAVRRLGVALFFAGRLDDAIQLLEVSRRLSPDSLEGLLFLGNAYFSQERLEEAIDAWEAYVEAAGGPERAGRVPSLIANAQEALEQAEDTAATPAATPASTPAETPVAPETPATQASPDTDLAGADLGQHLFSNNCASCHGALGDGGIGPRLAGNPTAADVLAVRRIVSSGRGMMPGFGQLSDDELDALARFVSERIYPEDTTSR
ncbi:hypothetical protein BH24DEI1_BH24DEI1_11250 [soil metagenome]